MPDPIRSLQQLIITNFGLSPSGYTGSRGDTGYVGSGGLGYTGSAGIGYTGSAAAGGGSTSPTITAITYPDNDTAADPAGGQTVTLTGTNFDAGAQVIINGNVASVVSVVNSTTITFTAPPNSVGSYIVYVVNTNGGTALAVPGIQYSGTPAWTTAAGTLGTYNTNISITANLTATGDAPITYSLYSGTLPAGLTLSANTGVISGTTPNVASSTTYNFTVRSTDAQQQDTDRAFSIIVSPVTPPTAVEYLVIGGGGGAGGGRQYGGPGGGGAGGYRTATGFAVASGSAITVTVGAGGPGGALAAAGLNGTDSVFGSITSVSGGYGYTGGGAGGGAGGSGGGGGGYYADNNAYAGGAGTAGQGNAGGSGLGAGGGGGGGAGAAGSNGNNSAPGNGGSGSQSSISGTATYYAGGGGGGFMSGSANGGSGGSGGGGFGANYNSNAIAGTANTGGGGGAGGGGTDLNLGSARPGTPGGSGVVIIRYPDIHSNAASTTGSPTATTSGGYKIYTWTTSGSITF